MRIIYASLIFIFPYISFASVIHECTSKTTIHEVITQPTYKNSGRLIIRVNESVKSCLCEKLPSSDVKQISVDINWSHKKDIEVLDANNIEVSSQCGSSMGSNGKAIPFNIWYIKKVLY